MDSLTVALILCLLQLGCAVPVPELKEIDVDGGKDNDIFDINKVYAISVLDLDLFEGDIKRNEISPKNSIIGDQYRWPIPVPYFLEDSLEINAKALVLEAFERYRLKSCIDFKPWDNEPNYISVFKDSGCYSYVGNLRRGKQQLSLGTNCDRIATIQHEFLHALGFWHEQSRADRDDYVNIIWERIQPGRENNFNKYNDTRSSALNVPYDYTSVMHYSKTAFQNVSEPTIVTRIPAFSDVIGQRMDFSDYDLEKLNRLYNCSSSLTFLDSCTFEYNNICGMVQGTGDNADWQHVLGIPTGPSDDHTNLGKCTESGYFMHFSTAEGGAGHKALLESRLFYPKRDFQCLQFFYYNSGHVSDQLNIWIREYTTASPNGILKFISTVNGQPADYWQLHHQPLNVANKFRVVFEGVKGNGISTGGFSIDDINFSEARCPHHVWHIQNFTHEASVQSGDLLSPPFYSPDGYAFQVRIRVNGNADKPHDLGIYFLLISGANDETLQWPCSLRQATMELMDQNPDIRKRMSNLRSITTDPEYKTDAGLLFWDKPEIVGTLQTFPNGTTYYRSTGYGTSAYITHDRLHSRDFLKGGDMFILLSVDDVTYLNASQPTPKPTIGGVTSLPVTTTKPGGQKLCEDIVCLNEGVCAIQDQMPVCRCKITKDWWYVGERCERRVSSQDTVVIAVSSSVTIFVVMLIITLVSVFCLKKKHKKQLGKLGESVTLENKYSS
ncbi:meprin A subunit beta-like [Pelodytes ibericus]